MFFPGRRRQQAKALHGILGKVEVDELGVSCFLNMHARQNFTLIQLITSKALDF